LFLENRKEHRAEGIAKIQIRNQTTNSEQGQVFGIQVIQTKQQKDYLGIETVNLPLF